MNRLLLCLCICLLWIPSGCGRQDSRQANPAAQTPTGYQTTPSVAPQPRRQVQPPSTQPSPPPSQAGEMQPPATQRAVRPNSVPQPPASEPRRVPAADPNIVVPQRPALEPQKVPDPDPYIVQMTQRIDQLDREASIHCRRADDYKRDADFFKECGSPQDYVAASNAALRELQLAESWLSQRDQAMYQLAEYLLQKGKREDAVMWFKRVHESQLGVSELGRAARARLQQLGEW